MSLRTKRKEREKEQRYQAIINAAETVFFSKGYETSTMDDVALEAELSKGTLYLYFKSKDDLHFAIMERGMKLLMSLMERRMHNKNNGLETLRELGLALVEFSNLHPDYFRNCFDLLKRNSIVSKNVYNYMTIS